MGKKVKPTMLMILDGYGANEQVYGNAVKAANTPNLDSIFASYPYTELDASGLAVGLPEGQMGNSEVGHLNIGAGDIIYQELTNITRHIKNGDFYSNPALKDAMKNAKVDDHALHIMGLLSDGGVHSHITHLKALLNFAKRQDVRKVYIHCFLDGRDVPPCSAGEYFKKLERHMNGIGLGQVGIITGRFYAMDRDKRWERLEKAYDALTLCEGIKTDTPSQAIELAYDRGETDEFVKPTVLSSRGIEDGDSVIFYNFRPDRAREITRAFVDPEFNGFKRKKTLKNLVYVCMTQYDSTIPNVQVAFPPKKIKVTLGGTISDLGLRQLRIAETEKYAHVTFFFNGGIETPYKNEDRMLIPSPKVETYDKQPEMSAYELTERVVSEINKEKYHLIILNYANADMVGHTGNFDATVKAIETLDKLVPEVVDAILKHDGQVLITADHGNADAMLDDTGAVITAHSLAKVPLCYVSNHPRELIDKGKLSDIAPTLLTIMGLKVPDDEMKGKILVK
ncbi:MAG: 2,3-bisphosphoglycerate-independent phosphoglycerate mutase [Clostridiales bacterium]|nr:2,3-bisphosphoglycerate-independent phosphoglycerate mutase [Clostridiales bacterium]